MTERGAQVCFRVDGGGVVGMGHVVRCLALAQILRDRYGCQVRFAMSEDQVGISHVAGQGWPVARVERDDLCDAECDAVIIDLPAGAPAKEVRRLRDWNDRALILLMHGMCDGRLEADLVVTPIERLANASVWKGFRGRRYEGPRYAILDPAYARVPKRATPGAGTPRLLVTMGGSDPYGLTLQTLRALDEMQVEDSFETTVALGPAFLHEAELQLWLQRARRGYEIRREKSLLDLMVASDVAVVSYGTTVFELAATGLPAIAFSITDDHLQSANVFARGGSLISLGLFSEVRDDRLRESVRGLLNDRPRRAAMALAGQLLVDGKGAERVAELLVRQMQEYRADATGVAK